MVDRRSSLFLFALLGFVFLTRLPYLTVKAIPFSFDHGKDSLAVLHLVKTFSPKLIGPWTSIPGLYFGPGWYYLLAPAFLLSNGSPIAPVFMMIALVMLQVYLAYHFLGREEAVVIATTPAWLGFSRSAWNPFPMAMLTLVALILLLKLRTAKNNSRNMYFLLLFLTASFGFHFSAAFAIFYILSLPVILFLRKIKVTFHQALFAIAGLILPFIPQLLFELRHNFVETRAVISYFSRGEPHQLSPEKVLLVLRVTLGEMRLALLPEMSKPFLVFALAILLFGAYLAVKKRYIFRFGIETIVLFLFSMLGFFVLHFNVWYVYALLPLVAVSGAELIRLLPRPARWMFLLLLFASPLVALIRFERLEKAQQMGSREMLPVKLRALEYVRAEAGGQPFASYHFVPDIYDFSYQYLYFWQAFSGKQLPTEFAYEPNVTSYIVEKADLLNAVPPAAKPPTAKPEKIFYIVEKVDNQNFLQSWWGRQQYGRIVKSEMISPDVTVYVAEPK